MGYPPYVYLHLIVRNNLLVIGVKLLVLAGETQYFNKMRKDNVTMLKIKWL